MINVTMKVFILFLFIECIGMTSVNKTIQVPGTQFCNTPSVHCVVRLPPQVKFPLSPLLKKEKTHGHGKQCGDCWSEGRWRKV